MHISFCLFFFFFKQKTAYEIGLGIPAEPLFRSAVGALRLSTVESIARPRRNGERRRAPTASISKESPAITGVVEMVIRRRSEERRVGKECRERWSAEREKKKKEEKDRQMCGGH